jgi:DNA repair protein RadB
MKIDLPEPLQSLLKGIEPKIITNFFGGPGTGKTNLCLFAALHCIKKGGRVVYIDTEGGFSVERLRQILQSPAFRDLKFEDVLNKIEIVEPENLSEQNETIKHLKKKNPDLVIVDSIVALYRLEYAETCTETDSIKSIMDANRELSRQLSVLSELSRKKGIPVIVTAHTYKRWSTGKNEMIGGDVLRYWSKAIIFLERTGRMSERKATIIKHQHLPEGINTKFMLVEDGISPVRFKLF